MKVITEIELREIWKKGQFTEYKISDGFMLTPAARQFLLDCRVAISDTNFIEKASIYASKATKINSESYTELNGKNLVEKHSPRIRFRGMLDTFYGLIVEIELLATEENLSALVQELKIIREYIIQMMLAEASGKSLPFINIHSWSSDVIRERSHYPLKYFGIPHFKVQPEDGYVMIFLNRMRTQVRELEVVGSEAFNKKSDALSRQDIMLALNRLSSIAYIMMCSLKAGEYQKD